MRAICKSLVLIALVAVLVVVLTVSSDESDGTTVEVVIGEGIIVGYMNSEHVVTSEITDGPLYLDESCSVWAATAGPEYGDVYINGVLVYPRNTVFSVGDYLGGIHFESFRDDYSIYFMNNGGSGNLIDSVDDLQNGSNCTIPNITYSLWGRDAVVWNTQEDGEGDDVSPGNLTIDLDFIRNHYAPATNRLNLYPKWVELEYSIVFHGNGGVGSLPNSLSPVTISSLIDVPGIEITRTGYGANVWNTSPDGNGYDVLPGMLTIDDYFINHCFGIGDSITLYPKWSETNYSITFNIGETFGTTPNPLNNITIGSSITLPGATFSKTGYDMVGWNTRSNSTGISLNIGERIADADFLQSLFTNGNGAILYPIWTVKTYQISLTTERGVISDEQWNHDKTTYSHNYTIESEDIALPSAVSDDRFHYFVCWEDENGNTIPSISRGTSGNISLSAVWALKEYSMSFNVNGKTVTQTCTLDTTLDDPECEEGFRFVGWFYKDQDGNETEFTSMSQMYENMSVYAVFEPTKDDTNEMMIAAGLLIAVFAAVMIFAFRKR